MLARNTKVSVQVQCPACLGGGVIWLSENHRTSCRACFGKGAMLVAVEDENEDSLWDEAMGMLELFGLEKDPEAYAYQWRDGWVVVDLDMFRRGGVQ